VHEMMLPTELMMVIPDPLVCRSSPRFLRSPDAGVDLWSEILRTRFLVGFHGREKEEHRVR
jgi:hypothetical protein